jgi:hypothetical protein
MKNFKYIKSIFCLCLTAVILTGCEADMDSELTSFVAFETVPKFAVERNTMDTMDVIVASADVVGTDRTFALVVDEDATTLGAVYSVPSTVTIPANSSTGTFTVTVTDDEMLGFDEQKLVISIAQEAGLNIGEALELLVLEQCEGVKVFLQIDFDAYAEEARWEIYDLSGTPTIISSTEYGDFDGFNNSSQIFPNCSEPGDYGIVVYDSYGDGGTTYTVTAGGAVLATGTVPGGNPANVETLISDTFTVE